MKKIYSAPELKIKRFDVEDIITTSTVGGGKTDLSGTMADNEKNEALNAVKSYFSSQTTKTTMKDVTNVNWNNW